MGYYCITNINAEFSPMFVDDLSKALQSQVQKKGQHYCPATFSEKKLGDVYVESLPCIWIDVDVPENYSSFEEGLKEWTSKIELAKLPQPTNIISSGSGLHLYWRFEEGQKQTKDWLLLRDALISKFMDLELKADYQHTKPSAYMRTPASINEKTNTLVKVVKTGEKVKFSELIVKVADYIQGGKKSGAITVSKVYRDKKLDWELIKSKCKAMEHASAPENQASVSEALWRATLSIAYQCENGENIIHDVSKHHPEYEPMKTDAKAQNTIPYTCQKIRECGGRCSECPHMINSPLLLGKAVNTTSLEEGKKVLDLEGNVATQIANYTIGDTGIYTTDKTGETVVVSAVPIYVGDVVENIYGEAKAGCYLEWTNAQNQPRREFLDFADLCNSANFTEWLAKRNLANKIFNLKEMVKYVLQGTSIMEKRALRTGVSHYGWQGEELVMPYGKVTKNGIEEAYIIGDLPTNIRKPTGVTKGCLQMVIRHLLEKNNGYLIAPMLMNMMAPLLPLLSVNPIVFYLSGQSGSGKSTVGYASMCLYGFVDKYNMFEGSTTMNALMDKMSKLNCLTLTLDEVNLGRRNDVRDIIMQAVNGRPKGRLNKEAKENTKEEWSTPLFITSNSTYSGIEGDRMDTAQDVRMVELSMIDSIKIGMNDITRMKEELVEDGANICMYIVKNKEELKQTANNILSVIQSDERYDPSMRFLASTWAVIKSGLKLIHDLYPELLTDILKVLPKLEREILWNKVPVGSVAIIDKEVNRWITENMDCIVTFGRHGALNEDKVRRAHARYNIDTKIIYIKLPIMSKIIKDCAESKTAFDEWRKQRCVDKGEIKKLRITGRSNPERCIAYQVEDGSDLC